MDCRNGHVGTDFFGADLCGEDLACLEWAQEMDDSVLELLCEDGFLEPEELSEAEAPGHRMLLLRRAEHRGFAASGRPLERLSGAVKGIVRRSRLLRRWKDVVRQVGFLRAPPCYL